MKKEERTKKKEPDANFTLSKTTTNKDHLHTRGHEVDSPSTPLTTSTVGYPVEE